jgi:dipeptidase D
VISFINLIPNGVLSMSNAMPGLTESSSNLGVIRTNAEGSALSVECTITSRSSIDAILDHVDLTIGRLSSILGATHIRDGRHPGWAFNPDSALQKDYIAVYRALYGEGIDELGIAIPRVDAIHAGLECGIICTALGEGSDAIAIGSDIWDLHSPDERMSLVSLARTYRLVCEMLARG